MSVLVPERFYIGFQSRARMEGDYDWFKDEEDTRTKKTYLLGFATYLEQNKRFEKRKDTIDRWAKECSWKRNEDVSPNILDNILREGFYIPEEVRRCGSWNGGNVVWRIVDPRGFELEISSNNLARIMNHTNINKGGIIEGKCIWGWDMKGGGKIVLLPEDSEPYREALVHTQARKQKVGLRDIQMGDTVQLQDGTEGIYLGKHNMLFRGYGGTQVFKDHSRVQSYQASDIKRRAAFLIKGDKLYLVAEPKISYLKEKTKQAYSLEYSVKKINEILKENIKSFTKKVLNPHGGLWGNEKPLMAFEKKPKEEDFQLVLLPLKKTFSEVVDLVSEDHSEDDAEGMIFYHDKENPGTLMVTELRIRGYYGELKKAQAGTARLHRGIFDENKKRWGIRYGPVSPFRHCKDDYEKVPENVEWFYPAITFEKEVYPLIYLPEE